MQFGLEITLETNQTQYLPLNFTTQKTTLIQTLLIIMKKAKKRQKSVKNVWQQALAIFLKAQTNLIFLRSTHTLLKLKK